MARLLEAAIAVIEAKGLAGVTIPDIASAAGLSTGAVYRRFADKDALIRTAFLQLLEASQVMNREGLSRDRFAGKSLSEALAAVSRALVRQYRARPALLKALDQFLETQTDPAFRERAIGLIASNMKCAVDALLAYRDQIVAPDADRAVTFALLSATTLIEVQILHEALLWRRMLPLDDDVLAAEAARMMQAYLTVAEPASD